MENMKQEFNAMELDLEQLKQFNGGVGDMQEETELRKSMRKAKESGMSFEQWIDTNPNPSNLRDASGIYAILKYMWEYTM